MSWIDGRQAVVATAMDADAERAIANTEDDPVQFARRYLEDGAPFKPMRAPRLKAGCREFAFRDLALRHLFVLLDLVYAPISDRKKGQHIADASATIRDSVREANRLRTLWVMREHKDAWEARATIMEILVGLAETDRELSASPTLEARQKLLAERAAI